MTNDFLVFGGAGGANVINQTAYLGLTARTAGFSSGVAQSAQLNKVWRQSSIMAAVLAQFISDRTGQDVLDDGTTATILANLKLSAAAVNGDVTKTFLVAPATLATHAMQLGQATGRLLRTTVYTRASFNGTQQVSVDGGASTTSGAGTFTALATTTKVIVEVIGAGAGSGSTATTSAVSASGGGGGGGRSVSVLTSSFTPQTITVGAGGAGGSTGGNGGNGSASSFGSAVTALGGSGSIGNTTAAASSGQLFVGAAGALLGVGNLITVGGGKGDFGWCTTAGQVLGGNGGASGTGGFGGVGVGTGQSANPGSTPGSGAGGVSIINGSTVAGGNGAAGQITVWEYA